MHELELYHVVKFFLSSELFIRTGIVLVLLGVARAGATMRKAATKSSVDVPSAILILIGVAILGFGIGWWIGDVGIF